MTVVRCTACDGEIKPERDYQKVEGYISKRASGGANTIALKKPLHEWKCWVCVEAEKRGLAGQASML